MNIDDLIVNAEANGFRVKLIKVTVSQAYGFYLKLSSIIGVLNTNRMLGWPDEYIEEIREGKRTYQGIKVKLIE